MTSIRGTMPGRSQREKGQMEPLEPREFEAFVGLAPLAPNVYSDGSADPLGTAIDVLVGTGCWWIQRQMQDHELTLLEGEFAQSTQRRDGLQLSAPLAGSYQTPMRAELCGAILVLSAKRPVFAAIDNAAVVKGINKALALIKLGRPFAYWRKPNADLWRVIWKILKSRRLGSVRAKWAKAHATEEHVRQGRTTREEAQHNERADHAAEEGRMLHRGACRGLMIHYRRILATYQQLVTEVRAHMLMVVKKVMDVMSEKEPEEMMNKKEEEGFTFFGGLNLPGAESCKG